MGAMPTEELAGRFRSPRGSTASPTPSATSSPRRRRSRRAGSASATSTSAIRSRSASRRRRIWSKPSHAPCATATTATCRRPASRRRAKRWPPTTRRAASPMSPDRVLITTGTSEGIELALNALVDEGDEVLVPSPTYPLYTAVLAKIGAQPRYYRTDPDARLAARSRSPAQPGHAADARARRHRSEQSDRRGVSRRRSGAR